MKRRYKKYQSNIYLSLLILIIISIITYYKDDINSYISNHNAQDYFEEKEPAYSLKDIPDYSNKPYVVINNNEPYFDKDDLTLKPLEKYSKLDSLNRCGEAVALVGEETMPTEPRGSIGMVKPSGWHTIKYDFIDGKYLYNRCHLIGYQLTGENANKENLITCTRYMNTVGMLEFENKVANYIDETHNHVLYRVTPIFKKDNLLANGVLMEAQSIEDDGKGIKFNVYVYNVQDGVVIDYANGNSQRE